MRAWRHIPSRCGPEGGLGESKRLGHRRISQKAPPPPQVFLHILPKEAATICKLRVRVYSLRLKLSADRDNCHFYHNSIYRFTLLKFRASTYSPGYHEDENDLPFANCWEFRAFRWKCFHQEGSKWPWLAAGNWFLEKYWWIAWWLQKIAATMRKAQEFSWFWTAKRRF